jgi:hypothetical protein
MEGGLSVVGCAVAVDRALVESFPPMRTGIIAEDVVLTRRAYLRNGVRYVPDVLVRYRVHSGGVSQVTKENRARDVFLPMQRRWVEDRRVRFEQARDDVRHAAPPNAEEMLRSLRDQEHRNDLRRRILDRSFGNGVRALFRESVALRGIPRDSLRVFAIRWFDPYGKKPPA